MHRFYIPDLSLRPKRLTLTDGEAVHAAKVLRVRPGDKVTVLNGKGIRAISRVVDVIRNRVELEVQRVEAGDKPFFKITLFQAVMKPRSMDWIVEKATELGVHSIQPILSERVISRMEGSEASKKAQKWQRTAVEALKQCGNLWLPVIESPQPFSEAIQHGSAFQCHLLASLSPRADKVRQALRRLNLHPRVPVPVRIGVWIGPEGDFTEQETRTLLGAGAIAITLGDNVLRSETAAVCALALVRYELGLKQDATRKNG